MPLPPSPSLGQGAGWPPSAWRGPALLLLAALWIVLPLSRAWLIAPDLGHGWMFPLLVALFWWERRGELTGWRPQPRRPHLPVRVVLVAALVAIAVLRLMLEFFPLWPVPLALHTLLATAVVLGLTHLLAGPRAVLWVGAPLVMLPGVLPWPTAVELHLLTPVREGLARLVAETTTWFGRPAEAIGTQVRLATGWVGVDEACGGIRSLHAAVTTALFFGAWWRLGWTRRLALLAAGVLAALGGNLLRVVFLGQCAASGPEVLDRWHDPVGWLALALSLVATGFAAYGLRSGPLPLPPRGTPSSAPAPTVRWLVAAVGLLVLLEVAPRLWFGQAPARIVPDPRGWTVAWPEHAPEVRERRLLAHARELLQPSLYRALLWLGPDERVRALTVVEWHDSYLARIMPFNHNPALCLPYSGAIQEASFGVMEVTWREHVLPFSLYRFRLHDRVLTVAFTLWDPLELRPLRSPGNFWKQRWGTILAVRRGAGAQLLAYAVEGEADADTLAREISQLLKPRGE